MPKIVSDADYQAVLSALERTPAGASLEQVAADLDHSISPRTLHRRLRDLIDQGRVASTGTSRATRYVLVTTSAPLPRGAISVQEPQGSYTTDEPYVPLSPEGREIRSHVRQPIQARRPVGYALGFLDAYRPNETAYLPQKLREQLHALGRAPNSAVPPPAPAGTFARHMLDRLLIDLSWASSHLEGNTYSRLDTERLIHFGEAAQGKDAIETQMILNHKAAIEYLVHHPSHLALDEETLIALHALLSDGLLPDATLCGRLRNHAVDIGGSVYRPVALPQRLEELFEITVATAAAVADPFEQAFFLMAHLPYLQPFEDMNKRVSRLAANIPLMRHNLCPLSFIDVPPQAYIDGLLGVYELNRIDLLRDVFVWAYERSCQQYVAVQSQLTPPDTFRLRYRVELANAIQTIVRGNRRLNKRTIALATPASVKRADRARFAQLVMKEFETLHAGNAVRFGLRPLELEGWIFEKNPR